MIHAIELDKFGDFSVELPKDTGKIVLNAFVDANGDGPTPGEPAGHTEEIEVKSAAVTGLTITLADTDASAKQGADPSKTEMGPPDKAGVAPAGEAGGAAGGKHGEGGTPPAPPK